MSKALKAQKILNKVLKASQSTQSTFNPRPSQLAAEIHQATRDWDRLTSMTIHADED